MSLLLLLWASIHRHLQGVVCSGIRVVISIGDVLVHFVIRTPRTQEKIAAFFANYTIGKNPNLLLVTEFLDVELALTPADITAVMRAPCLISSENNGNHSEIVRKI